MAHVPRYSAGRPGSALLILGAIFATAVIVRLPLGPAPVEPVLSTIAARSLLIWSTFPVASIDRPTIDSPVMMATRVSSALPLEPIRVLSAAWPLESAPPEAAGPSSSALGHAPMIGAEPALALAATPHNHFAGLAAVVTPVSFVEPPSSNPFAAVGTAFAKTGAALTLAFKKTGQGILAPF